MAFVKDIDNNYGIIKRFDLFYIKPELIFVLIINQLKNTKNGRTKSNASTANAKNRRYSA